MKVVPIKPEVNEDLVEKLEEFLGMAKSGELTEGACIFYARDGSLYTWFSETEDNFRRIAHLHRLIHHMQIKLDKQGQLT